MKQGTMQRNHAVLRRDQPLVGFGQKIWFKIPATTLHLSMSTTSSSSSNQAERSWTKYPPNQTSSSTSKSMEEVPKNRVVSGERSRSFKPPQAEDPMFPELAELLRNLQNTPNADLRKDLLDDFLKRQEPKRRQFQISSYLLPYIQQMQHSLQLNRIPDLLLILGKTGFRSHDPAHYSIMMDFLRRTLHEGPRRPKSTANLIAGLAKMGFRFERKYDDLKLKLFDLLGEVVDHFIPADLALSIHSICKVGIHWNDLPNNLQQSYLSLIASMSTSLQPMQSSMIMYALGVMSFDFRQAPPAVKDHLHMLAMSVFDEARTIASLPYKQRKVAQQCANVIYAFAKGNAKYSEFPPELQSSIENGIVFTSSYVNEQELAMNIYSMGLLGIRWSEISKETQEILIKSIMRLSGSLAPQGVSSALYGFQLMSMKYEDIDSDFWKHFDRAIINCFNSRRLSNPNSVVQAVANTIYSLGSMGVNWNNLTAEAQNTLRESAETVFPHFTGQETSMVIYGFGSLGAPFTTFSRNNYEFFHKVVERLIGINHEQDLCAVLHGFAKMGANYYALPEPFKAILMRFIAGVENMPALCIACTIYALGLMEWRWDELPIEVTTLMETQLAHIQLRDQTLSNTIYGLGLMGANMYTIQPEIINPLLKMLRHPEGFAEDIPQHITNAMWALGKIDVRWSILPQQALQEAFVRVADKVKRQELGNFYYGLSSVEVSWNDLNLETIQALERSTLRLHQYLNPQELANAMYSMALMTFDFPLEETYDNLEEETIRKAKLESMWKIHNYLLRAYQPKAHLTFNVENYDQFSAYFELLRITPGGKELVIQYLEKIPVVSGPSPTTPSRTHAMTTSGLLNELNSNYSPRFNIFHEFSGLRGLFPIDTALYYDDELVALIEVDGEFHYQMSEDGDQLRRKDFLKEKLYKYYYPNIELFRMKNDHIISLGHTRAGMIAAQFIAADLMKRNVLITDENGELVLPSNHISQVKQSKKVVKTRKLDEDKEQIDETNTTVLPKKKRVSNKTKATEATLSESTTDANIGIVLVDEPPVESASKKRGRKPKIASSE